MEELRRKLQGKEAELAGSQEALDAAGGKVKALASRFGGRVEELAVERAALEGQEGELQRQTEELGVAEQAAEEAHAAAEREHASMVQQVGGWRRLCRSGGGC